MPAKVRTCVAWPSTESVTVLSRATKAVVPATRPSTTTGLQRRTSAAQAVAAGRTGSVRAAVPPSAHKPTTVANVGHLRTLNTRSCRRVTRAAEGGVGVGGDRRCTSSSRSARRTSAIARTVCGTRYDALGRPR